MDTIRTFSTSDGTTAKPVVSSSPTYTDWCYQSYPMAQQISGGGSTDFNGYLAASPTSNLALSGNGLGTFAVAWSGPVVPSQGSPFRYVYLENSNVGPAGKGVGWYRVYVSFLLTSLPYSATPVFYPSIGVIEQGANGFGAPGGILNTEFVEPSQPYGDVRGTTSPWPSFTSVTDSVYDTYYSRTFMYDAISQTGGSGNGGFLIQPQAQMLNTVDTTIQCTVSILIYYMSM